MLGGEIPAFLTVQGATDGDTTADAIRLYDRVLPEPAASSVDPAKAIVWAYDIAHNDFGGFAEPTPKGAAVGGAYGEAWLRWHVYGAASPSRDFFAGPDGVFPPEVDEPSFWNTLPMNPDGEPRIFRGFTVEGNDRIVVDDLEAGGTFILEPRTLDVTVASAAMLADRTPHETTAVRVTWAPGTEGGLRWTLGDLAAELPQYSDLSVRVGQVVEVVDDAACTIASDEPVGLRIEFDMGRSGVVSLTTDDLPAEIPAQDHRLIPVLLSDPACVTSNFLRTIRVPLSLACAQGVVLDQVESIAIVFDQAPAGSVILDTLELTRSPEDVGDACR